MGWDVKDLMLLQAGLELVLLAAVVVLLRRTRAKVAEPPKVPEGLEESMERFVTEADRLAGTFQQNLEDKRRLASDLILKLDRRLADYRELLAATEEAVAAAEGRLAALGGEIINQAERRLQAVEPKANPAAPEVRAEVLRLAKKGLSVEEIAVKSNLHRGEVELIIDLDQGEGGS